MTDTAALWSAVDKITSPTTQPIERATIASSDWLNELRELDEWAYCQIADHEAATRRVGSIPSLWVQAEQALTTGSEQSIGRSPLATRSPADLALMETMATIRETIAWKLAQRRITPRATVPLQLRQLAAHVGGHEPDRLEWWTYRVAQWARLLANYLQAVDNGPRAFRLRAPCPHCGCRQTTAPSDVGPVTCGPILIDYNNGLVRSATCTVCGHSTPRSELNDLADAIHNAEQRQETA